MTSVAERRRQRQLAAAQQVANPSKTVVPVVPKTAVPAAPSSMIRNPFSGSLSSLFTRVARPNTAPSSKTQDVSARQLVAAAAAARKNQTADTKEQLKSVLNRRAQKAQTAPVQRQRRGPATAVHPTRGTLKPVQTVPIPNTHTQDLTRPAAIDPMPTPAPAPTPSPFSALLADVSTQSVPSTNVANPAVSTNVTKPAVTTDVAKPAVTTNVAKPAVSTNDAKPAVFNNDVHSLTPTIKQRIDSQQCKEIEAIPKLYEALNEVETKAYLHELEILDHKWQSDSSVRAALSNMATKYFVSGRMIDPEISSTLNWARVMWWLIARCSRTEDKDNSKDKETPRDCDGNMVASDVLLRDTLKEIEGTCIQGVSHRLFNLALSLSISK